MAILQGFPIKNQRTTVTSSGQRDINADYDCTAECLAAVLQYYTGRNFEGGVLKELVYGTNYRGGTAASAYVQTCAHYGVHLFPIDGDPNALALLAHGHIKANHAVLITEDDPYLPKGSGWTHVIVLDEEHPGGVIAMDPFIAQSVSFTDAELAAHMAVREVWIAERIQEGAIVSISLTTPGVPHWFKAGSGNAWICIETGCVIHDGNLNFYRTMSGALAGLTQGGLPTNNEHKPKQPKGMSDHDYRALLQSHPEITEQDLERFTLRYDPHKIMDNPPGAGATYIVHQDIQAAVDTAAQDALQAQLDEAHKQVAALQKKIQGAEDALKA